MNETIKVLLKRRSVRVYLKEQIDDKSLQAIIQTGLYAPNGGNHQYARFLVIQDAKKLNELKTIVKNEFAKKDIIEDQYQNKTIIKAKQQEDYDFSFGAPILIIAMAPKVHSNSMADCANALGNMQIAATALGLGACWVNQLHWLTDNQAVRSCLGPLGLGEEENIFGSIVLGHPGKPLQKPSARKEGRVIIINTPTIS